MSSSLATATAAADEWMPYIRTWLIQAIMDPKQHRDIGKVLAQASEAVSVEKLSAASGRPLALVVGQSYDSQTTDDKPLVRAQHKFRMGNWHFETTRRNSKKNADTNATGHVAYRATEFDVCTILVPGPNFGITGSYIRCIPTSALINPKKPDQLVTNINAALRKKYDTPEATMDVVKSLY
jgi:uncharacterized linocin/CFP29 family protein